MGFFSRVKDVGSVVFNFKVNKWIGYDQIKSSTKNIFQVGQSLVTPEHADYQETFEQALQRLNITEEQLKQRLREFTVLLIVYILIAVAVFSYSIYIAIKYKNLMGFIMGFGVTIFALVNAFKYHFWIYQIKHRKLGCTLKEWFLDKP